MRDASVRGDASVGWLVAEAADEYVECLQRGEHPRLEAFQAEYPQAASVLPQVFEALRLMQSSAASPSRSHDERSEAPTPAALGEYRLVREIGRGGMGVVYEAVHASLGRRVAVKVLPLGATFDPKQRARFGVEARAAAALDHPNIVPVLGVGCDRGVHFYAMQYIDGASLADVIRECRDQRSAADGGESHTVSRLRADGEAELARLGLQAADALAHAHANGVVHRDIKPANLLLDTSGKLWVTDFGLARFQSEPGMTLTGDLLGTLRYMSPEQALAKRCGVDHRTDVYSLGATLYELATLEPVFPGGDRQELLRQIAFKDPTRPRQLNPQLSADCEAVILRALEKDPDRRYPTARELAADLRRLQAGEPIAARQGTTTRAVRRLAIAVPALAILVVLIWIAASWISNRPGLSTTAEGADRSANSPIRPDAVLADAVLNRHGEIELHRFTAEEGRFEALDQWFRETGGAILARHGIRLHFINYEIAEDTSEPVRTIYCWLSYPHGADREELWNAFKNDRDCAPLFGADGRGTLLKDMIVDTLTPLPFDEPSTGTPIPYQGETP